MKPIRRNFLQEAYKIHSGDRNINPKKEHVCAVIEQSLALGKRIEMLSKLMDEAYKKANEERKQKGMPPLPPQNFAINVPKAIDARR